jgi:hypothetical protein
VHTRDRQEWWMSAIHKAAPKQATAMGDHHSHSHMDGGAKSDENPFVNQYSEVKARQFSSREGEGCEGEPTREKRRWENTCAWPRRPTEVTEP